MYIYQNHDMILFDGSYKDAINAHILRYFDDSFQTTWVVRQGVVSTDSTLSGYWYQKEEVINECLESNGYVKDC